MTNLVGLWYILLPVDFIYNCTRNLTRFIQTLIISLRNTFSSRNSLAGRHLIIKG